MDEEEKVIGGRVVGEEGGKEAIVAWVFCSSSVKIT
jgi:hypothetical protein